MKYLDIPATCRVCFEDNGELSLAICIVDDLELFGQFVAHFAPAHIRHLADAIKAAEDKPKRVPPDEFDLDDSAGDRAREAEAEESERLYGAS